MSVILWRETPEHFLHGVLEQRITVVHRISRDHNENKEVKNQVMKLLSEKTDAYKIVDFNTPKNLELKENWDNMSLFQLALWVALVSRRERCWWSSWVEVQKVHQVLEHEIESQISLKFDHQVCLILEIGEQNQKYQINQGWNIGLNSSWKHKHKQNHVLCH